MKSGASVGRRLFLLVAIQTAISLLLVLVAVRRISDISSDYHRMYDFQFESVVGIGEAVAEASTLKEGDRSARLEDFYKRYRSEWETASGTTPDAIHFRKELAEAGATNLLIDETEILGRLHRALVAADATETQRELTALHALNVRYAALDNHFLMEGLRFARRWIIAVGIAGATLTMLMGLYVRNAIAPRIKRLVGQVGRFQATGKFEPTRDSGTDDIAVLANALDMGFSSIAKRDHEREQFLSIAAHELKTPVSSIHGYALLLVEQPPDYVNARRALETINRQSWRLSRLIDRLFLGIEAMSGKLQFEPKPFDLSTLVERVLNDIEPLVGNKTFSKHIERNISVIGDEALLEHAIWCLIACSASFSEDQIPLKIGFSVVKQQARLAITINRASASIPELQELFLPFHFVQYETEQGIRSATGLYLCREIVRLHNGSLRAEQLEPRRPEFVMEIPT